MGKKDVAYWKERINTCGVEKVESDIASGVIGPAFRDVAQKAVDMAKENQTKEYVDRQEARDVRAIQIATTANTIANSSKNVSLIALTIAFLSFLIALAAFICE